MAIDKFIPDVWSARLLRILEPRLILAGNRIVNHDYEGDIAAAGDTVHIRGFNTAGTIRNYQRNTPMATPDVASDTELTLVVDQQKAFYLQVDDIDVVQADITIMDKFLERTGRAMADVLDRHAAAKFISGALAANTLGTTAAPKTMTKDGASADFDPYSFCVEARRLLQRQSTPGNDRWMVINSDLEALFLKSPQLIQGGAGIGDASVVRNGSIGRIAGFDILVTEAVPTAARLIDANLDGDTADAGDEVETLDHVTVLFGDGNYAQTWADQIIKTEAERLQGQFSDAVKGLHVYGSKIVENTSYGVARIDPA